MKLDAKQVTGIIPVANGGTGASDAAGARTAIGAAAPTDTVAKATSLAGGAAGNLVYQSATGTTAYVSNGTNGQLLQSNGAGAPSFVTFAGGFSNIAVFTATSAWTIPAGITKCKVTVVGGGGNGGTGGGPSCGSYYSPGGGGGGGGTAIKFLSGLTPGNTLNCTIGGASGNSTLTSGTQTIATITGGGGGNGGALAAGGGGSASGGDINITGSAGQNSVFGNGATYSRSGSGGSSTHGGGGVAGSGVGGQYGGGGGGGNLNSTGGAGTQGVIIIEF